MEVIKYSFSGMLKNTLLETVSLWRDYGISGGSCLIFLV